MQLNQQWHQPLDDKGSIGGISARPLPFHSQAYSNFSIPMGAFFPGQPAAHTSNFPMNFSSGQLPSDPSFQLAGMMGSGNGWLDLMPPMGQRSAFPQSAGMLPRTCLPPDATMAGTSGLDFQALAKLQAQQAAQLQQMQLKLQQMQAQQQALSLPLARPQTDLQPQPTSRSLCGAYKTQDCRKTHNPDQQDPVAIEAQGSGSTLINNCNQTEGFVRANSDPKLEQQTCHGQKGAQAKDVDTSQVDPLPRACDSTTRSQKRLGRKGHLAIHHGMLKQQAMLMEQLFDLHKLAHMQNLLQGMEVASSPTPEGGAANQEECRIPREVLRALMGHSQEDRRPDSVADTELAKQVEADTTLLIGTIPSSRTDDRNLDEEPEDSAPLSHGVIKPTPTKLSLCEELKGTLTMEARRKQELAQEGDVNAMLKHLAPRGQASISGGMRLPPSRSPSRLHRPLSGKEGGSRQSVSFTDPSKLLDSGSTQPRTPPTQEAAPLQEVASVARVQVAPASVAPSVSEAPPTASGLPAGCANISKEKRTVKPSQPSLFATQPRAPPQNVADKPSVPTLFATKPRAPPNNLAEKPSVPTMFSTQPRASPHDLVEKPPVPTLFSSQPRAPPHNLAEKPSVPTLFSTQPRAPPQNLAEKPSVPTLFASRPLGPPQNFAVPPPVRAPKIDLHEAWYNSISEGEETSPPPYVCNLSPMSDPPVSCPRSSMFDHPLCLPHSAAAASQGCPPPPVRAPKIDLHEAWYNMHFRGGGNISADPSGGPSSMQPPDAMQPPAAITDHGVQPYREDSLAAEQEMMESRRREEGQATGQVVRWWQDQVQTFGDIDLMMDSSQAAISKTGRGSAGGDPKRMKRTDGRYRGSGSLGQGMFDHLLAMGPGNSSFSGSGLFSSAFQSGMKSSPSGLNGLRSSKQDSAFKALSKGNSQRGSNNHLPRGSKGDRREPHERDLSDGSESSHDNGSQSQSRKAPKHHHAHQSTKPDGGSLSKDTKNVN
eukprot:gene5993-5284_t